MLGVGFITRLCLSPFYSLSCRYLFFHSVCRSCSGSFQTFFRGDCSTRGCRSGMAVGGGEFRILLSCHLEPPPQVALYVSFFSFLSIPKAYKLFSEPCKMPGIFLFCFYDYSRDLDNSTERNPLPS